MIDCKHHDPLKNYSYCGAAERAEELIRRGWVQRRCDKCGLWTIWERSATRTAALKPLLAREQALRKDWRRVATEKIKLEVKLAKVQDQINKMAAKVGIK